MFISVKGMLTEEMLGTASANPDIHREFIASKSKDADKVKEELEALSAGELIEKAMTVFPKDETGRPFIWNYQVKGFLKEAIGALIEIRDGVITVNKTKITKYTFKRMVDNYIFVTPRKIMLSCDHVGPTCTRPLRCETMKGERVTLASSETVPDGSMFSCVINVMAESMEPLVKEALQYGQLKGLGQWRNSGKGTFESTIS